MAPPALDNKFNFFNMATPKYKRNSGKEWTDKDVSQLRKLAKGNTPTGVISLKIGRTKGAIYNKASEEDISLDPANKSPYNRIKK